MTRNEWFSCLAPQAVWVKHGILIKPLDYQQWKKHLKKERRINGESCLDGWDFLDTSIETYMVVVVLLTQRLSFVYFFIFNGIIIILIIGH